MEARFNFATIPTGRAPGHATRLLALASDLLSEAGLAGGTSSGSPSESDRERSRACASASPRREGLAQSLGVELVGVSSLLALSHAVAREQARREDGVLAVIDARRGEVFAGGTTRQIES